MLIVPIPKARDKTLSLQAKLSDMPRPSQIFRPGLPAGNTSASLGFFAAYLLSSRLGDWVPFLFARWAPLSE